MPGRAVSFLKPEFNDNVILSLSGVAMLNSSSSVAINYSSDASAAEKLVEEIGSSHAIAIKADAGSILEIERMVAETVQKFGKIDVLVPNAGILPMKDLEHTTEADFDRTMQLNVKGPYFLVQVCLLFLSAAQTITHKTQESGALHAGGLTYRPDFNIFDSRLNGLPRIPSLQYK